MKKILGLSMVVFGILFLSQTANAQGRWVSYMDSQTGRTVKCYMPYEGAICQSEAVVVERNNSESRHPNRSVLRQSRRYYESERYRETRLAKDQTEVPYYETQERTTVRRSYGWGIDRWSGRPYGHYEVRTETVRVRAEANSLTFRPTISISTTYWPNY